MISPEASRDECSKYLITRRLRSVRCNAMESTRVEALLEAIQAVQDSVSRLEREVMAALSEGGKQGTDSTKVSDTTDEWFTLPELGERLKVSRTTAYRLVSSNELPAYRIGRAIRVRRTDIERWLMENRWEIGG